MTDATKAGFVNLIKTFSTLLGATVLIGSLAIGVVAWALGVQTIEASKTEHKVIEDARVAGDDSVHIRIDQAHKKIDAVVAEIRPLGRDIKVVKCMLRADSKRQKARCGLE